MYLKSYFSRILNCSFKASKKKKKKNQNRKVFGMGISFLNITSKLVLTSLLNMGLGNQNKNHQMTEENILKKPSWACVLLFCEETQGVRNRKFLANLTVKACECVALY